MKGDYKNKFFIKIKRVDAHIHLPIIKKGKTFENSKRKLFSDLEKNKIDYSILIPDNIPNSKMGDLDKCLELIKNEKNIFLLGTISLKFKQSEIKKIDLLFKESKIKGIKIFPGHDPIYPDDKRLISVYKLCIKYNLPIVIHTGENSKDSLAAKYNDPKYILKIAKIFPELKIIIAHYFWPKVEYCYNLTRGYDNIYFDTSALADEEVMKKTGKNKIKNVLEKTIKDNPKSVLFGSDYACCNIQKHIKLIESLNISEKQKEMVFSKNAVKLFQLEN